MSDRLAYILGKMRVWIWSGYYTKAALQPWVEDLLINTNVDRGMVLSLLDEEYEKKRIDEAAWPAQTDCDRLDEAFRILDKKRVLGLQNAGDTMSEGHENASYALARNRRRRYVGYCFFHGQDVERAVSKGELLIAFDCVKDRGKTRLEVGKTVREVLRSIGFSVIWDGTAESRIELKNVDWKRRSFPRPESNT